MSAKNRGVLALKPFIPAKDYELSTRFYKDLGFTIAWESHDVKELNIDRYSFLLQNFYQKEWADNFMVHLRVQDLDAWWEHIEQSRLVDRYPAVRAKEPFDYPWGLREIHLTDPSGVLWHIAQTSDPGKD